MWCFNEAPALRGGNPLRRSPSRLVGFRFNEAPALRGGNPAALRRRCRRESASMRPPHCAGEICRFPFQQMLSTHASMRPPHCAGEITANDSVLIPGNGLQ